MENNYINMIPIRETPVYHFSQDDSGREIKCSLYNGLLAEILTGTETIKLYCQTPDKRLSILDVANTASNYVIVAIPDTLTATAGKVYCKLRINGIGAKAFYLDIERRP